MCVCMLAQRACGGQGTTVMREPFFRDGTLVIRFGREHLYTLNHPAVLEIKKVKALLLATGIMSSAVEEKRTTCE